MIFEKHEYVKQIRKEDAQAQCLLILLNHYISKFRTKSDEQNLKNFKTLISSQIAVSLKATTSFIDFKTILKLKPIL